MSGVPFLLEGRLARVTERFASPNGLQSDGIIIRFAGACTPGQVGTLGTTVASLEQRIADGQVQFLKNATTYNRGCGWPADRVDVAPTFGSPYRTAAKTTELGRRDSVIADHAIFRDAGPTRPLRTRTPKANRLDHRSCTSPGYAAFLSVLTLSPWTFVTEIRDCLWLDWQPEWGPRPSYSTVWRWVKGRGIHASSGLRIVPVDSRRSSK